MSQLRYTLITDGSSDRALMPILNWVLKEHIKGKAIQSEWAELRNHKRPPKELSEKIKQAITLYPCDVVFIHRDAENQSPKQRFDEIQKAIDKRRTEKKYIPVVPIRMIEAWLLIDEAALRRAAGNPNGHEKMEFPKIKKLESLPDPKKILYDLLRQASGKKRGVDKSIVAKQVHRLAELITNFDVLRQLSAFKKLEEEIIQLSNHLE